MKTTELRIGNYLLLNEDSVIFKVKELNQTGISVQNDNEETWIEIEAFFGIELTPEILLKCGFVQDETYDGALFIYLNKHDLDVDKISFAKSDGMVRIEIPGRRDSCILMKNIKYLHQLQNLYYALTQTEINFKP